MKQKKTAGRKKAAKYKKYAGYVVVFILLAAVAAVLVETYLWFISAVLPFSI